MIDLHSHILPGFDDGARTLEEARDMARSAIAEGVTTIAATPHVRSDFPTTPAKMEQGVARLSADFEREHIPLRVLHGGELAIERFWDLTLEDISRFSLGQTGRYVLVEFPYQWWLPIVDATVTNCSQRGLTALLAHPERNADVQAAPERVRELVEAGALVQVTAASIAGYLGRLAQAAARRLLELRLVHVLASDSHGPHIRQGGMAEVESAVGDAGLAHYLTEEVPAAIAAGEDVPTAL